MDLSIARDTLAAGAGAGTGASAAAWQGSGSRRSVASGASFRTVKEAGDDP